MCDTRSKRHKNHEHSRQIKIFKCRLHEFCMFSFIFYCATCGIFCDAYHVPVNATDLYEDLKTRSIPLQDSKHDNGTEAVIVISQQSITTDSTTVQGADHDSSKATVVTQQNDHLNDKVRCDDSGCYLKISSSKQALENMMSASRQLYQNYANLNGSEETITEESLKNLLHDLQPKEKLPETSHDHDHGHGHEHEHTHDHDHDHETESPVEDDHDHSHDSESESLSEERTLDDEIWDSLINYFSELSSEDNATADEIPCYKSVKDLTEAYFKSSENLQLSFGDFISLLPQIMLDITRPGCEESHDDDNTQDKSAIKQNTKNVWLMSFASVTVISVVSLCGVLTIPVLRYSKILNHLIAYLVALAVGTLCGDALLHLLPQALGVHDHSHGSGSHNEAGHFDFMWKGLVVCAGIYFFFLLETIMEFIHRRKKNSSCLGKHSHCHSNREEHECDAESTNSDDNQRLKQGNTIVTPSGSPLLKKNDGKHDHEVIHITPLINGGEACNHGEHDGKPDGHRLAIKFDEEPLDTGHHHHHHSNEVPKTIASLAWMVIVGDGLHNITDGLAIGAAFTSSIGAGLGTALAIFCHEIPQELADFAVLLNAGMTAKQALFWNFLSACTCFVGLVVGLLVGEYTNGIIVWILAFTAGGFLYIALVDMLPALMKQLSQKGYKKRYLIQNVGIVSGFGLMVLIALKEESFESYFQN